MTELKQIEKKSGLKLKNFTIIKAATKFQKAKI